MREFIIFHQNIYYEIKKLESDCCFILLSVDSKDVYWFIKINNNDLNEDFMNLLKFIILDGVKIIGVLYYQNIHLNYNTKHVT